MFPTIACLITLGVLCGCNTTESSIARKEPVFLKKGMTGEEVIELIGEPVAVKQHTELERDAQTWIYEESKERIRQVQSDTREVPYIHPITGQEGYITEAVDNIRRESVTLVTELYLLDGILVGWKESMKESATWDN